ncbi:Smr/MutS family protein [Winogradskyella sp. DF17]|uniref:Smr/MutS family protein n=1 Tax=Winogradskyella pelagia TaxID=2819984 RepID=A0ABS3T384_9FLAO|nr:Smr/MutS family protein [Winogradskyella sp. DF17]MBO3116351.1 Smr/MutS family protein [Winogradskyella sp. DF17]
MTIKIGDTVEAIDEDFIGVVKSLIGNTVKVEDADGFIIEFQSHEVMLSASNRSLDEAIYKTDFETVKQQKQERKPKPSTKAKPKDRQKAHFVIDLHIHQLRESTKGMTNFDMLNLQLDTARQQLEFAIRKRIPKMVFVHGVGEGVLRQELYTLLRRYNNVEFYDADYKTYGLGATEVKIFQNIAP